MIFVQRANRHLQAMHLNPGGSAVAEPSVGQAEQRVDGVGRRPPHAPGELPGRIEQPPEQLKPGTTGIALDPPQAVQRSRIAALR